MKKRSWKKYAFEFLSIFIAVISAFALNNWNEDRRNNNAENKILVEIALGLEKDIEDIEHNIRGHKNGIHAVQFWRDVLDNKAAKLDSASYYYFSFLRDYISIQNTSGYENLKSRGLELVKNDSLRTNIIALYEYDYRILKSLEEDYFEMQFFQNYFKEINNYIAPHLQYDSLGKINGIELPIDISERDKKILLSYLWKVEDNRTFLLKYYGLTKETVAKLRKEIEAEIQ